jgi:hypothetical protein
MGEDARREAIEKAMQAVAEPGTPKEAIPLPYKEGKGGPYTVITLPVDAVLFNPRSHRIKSQLESHPKQEVVRDDPYSDEAQQAIHEILRNTEDFDGLKANLSEYGQSDAGVVTRTGLLVNANRRLAALRDLGRDYIRAALLPSDADEHAIDRLELELQVRRDYKEDYTFTNELIFINDLLNKHGYSEEKVAKALNWSASADEKELKRGVNRVRQWLRLYALVRYIQQVSGTAIPLTFFDDKRQALIDVDDRYESLKGSDPDGAERMKTARILGVISGTFYRELRRIDGASAFDTLLTRLGEKTVVGSEVTSLMVESVTEHAADDRDDANLLSQAEATRVGDPDLLPLLKLIAGSFGKDALQLPSGKEVVRDDVVQEIAEAIDETAEEVHAGDKFSKSLNGPVKALEEAVARAKVAAAGYQQVHNTDGFAHGKFKYHANKLRIQAAAVDKLIEQHGK